MLETGLGGAKGIPPHLVHLQTPSQPHTLVWSRERGGHGRPRIAGRVQLQVTSTHGRMQSHRLQPCTPAASMPSADRITSLSGPGTGQTDDKDTACKSPAQRLSEHHPALPGDLTLMHPTPATSRAAALPAADPLDQLRPREGDVRRALILGRESGRSEQGCGDRPRSQAAAEVRLGPVQTRAHSGRPGPEQASARPRGSPGSRAGGDPAPPPPRSAPGPCGCSEE